MEVCGQPPLSPPRGLTSLPERPHEASAHVACCYVRISATSLESTVHAET